MLHKLLLEVKTFFKFYHNWQCCQVAYVDAVAVKLVKREFVYLFTWFKYINSIGE